jgi:tetratricopeptide (TPR) repeat protein
MESVRGRAGSSGDGLSALVSRPRGRESILDATESFLDAVASAGGMLVFEGEPGIGKTTVWEVARQRSIDRGFRVLTSRPAEAESSWPYIALIDILSPVLDEVRPHLPGPQVKALDAASLQSEPDEQLDHRTVSVGLLSALKLLAEGQPVVVCIDDLHWLDDVSAAALTSAIRRMAGAPVALITAVRSGHAEQSELVGDPRATRLELGPLSVGALAQVIKQRLGATLPRPALVRVHEASGGNPLYALEVATTLMQTGTTVRPGEPLPIPDDLQQLLAQRVDGISEASRRLTLLTASVPRPTVLELGELFGPDFEKALDETIEAGVLVESGGRLRFTHPLLGSAAYGSATAAQRREAHAALAEAAAEADGRARHLRLATVQPDEGGAAAVERGARVAASRGASQDAAALYERAAELTPSADQESRRDRTVSAAEHFRLAGEQERAIDLLGAVEDWPPGFSRSRGLLILAHIHSDAQPQVANELFRKALESAGDDPEVGVAAELGLAWTSVVSGAWDAAHAHAQRATDLAEAHGSPIGLGAVLATLVDVTFLSGGGIDEDLIERAIACEMSEPVRTSTTRALPSDVCGSVLKWSGEFDRARDLLLRGRERALEFGDEHAYAIALYHLAELEIWAGRWTEAAAYSAEGIRSSPATGHARAAVLYAAALVDAHVGRAEEARTHANEGVELAQQTGASTRLAQNASVLAFLALSDGDAKGVIAQLEPIVAFARGMGIAEPGVLRWAPDAIEALIHLGRLEEAGDTLDWFEGLARNTRRWWALATSARCRGLLHAAEGDLDEALKELDFAMEHHEHVAEPFEKARTLLALGATRRRTRRKASAREALNGALGTFEDLGAPLWAERVREELSRYQSDHPCAACGGYRLKPQALSVKKAGLPSM